MKTAQKAFENNPEKVALAVFKGNGKPSGAWNFFNRPIMFMNGTADARGFRQLKQEEGEIDIVEVDEIIHVEKLLGFKPLPSLPL